MWPCPVFVVVLLHAALPTRCRSQWPHPTLVFVSLSGHERLPRTTNARLRVRVTGRGFTRYVSLLSPVAASAPSLAYSSLTAACVH